MPSSKEYQLAIKIAAEIDKSLYNGTAITRKELQNIARDAVIASNATKSSFSRGIKDLDPVFTGLDKVAAKTFKAITVGATAAVTATVAIGTAAINAGKEFESAFAGVKKTTEATEAEYEVLRQGILDMSETIPATASEIAGVAESAGQLGIAKENLLDFTRVMIDLGESTNLSAEEGASALAKFANVTKMAPEYYSNLGSVVVALGNNFATTEADIVEMGTRLAASGELAGLTEAQIMALATSMSSVGIEAEAGGSAMSKLIKQIQLAVELGGDGLQEFSSVAGMTGEEFQQVFQEDAVEALSAFIGGLNDTERNGKSAIAILDEMGLTEVRLSNTILSLANANGVMTDAIQLANTAWEENTALVNEAAQRYETTDSKLSMLQNSITRTGIEIYDYLQAPFRAGIDIAREFVGDYSDAIVGFFADISAEVPTTIRTIKQAGEDFSEFAAPVISLGEWALDNPDVITSMLVGIGSTLATYKVAQQVNNLGKAFGTLTKIMSNPAALGILAVGAAIGGAAGLGYYISKCQKEMAKASLEEHFGDITLSLEDLEAVASHIVQTDSIGKAARVMDIREEMETISSSISDTIESLNKANWKVSIGMELTEDERQQYLSDVESFIAGSQELLTQQQYAMSISLELFTDDDAEGAEIRSKVDAFYSRNQQTLADLGAELSAAVNEAFQDGLLEVDEAKEIAELQKQMADITEKLAQSEFSAQMEVLGLKYSGGALDPDTFKNLQAELGEYVQTAQADLEESLKISIAGAQVMLEDGAINQTEYDSMIAEYKENYLEQMGEIELKASSFQMDTIKQQYSDEVSAAIPELQKTVQEQVETLMNSGAATPEGWSLALENAMTGILSSIDLSSADRGAISQLLEQLAPTQEELEALKAQYEALGQEVPAEILQSLNDYTVLQALTGQEDAIWNMVGSQLGQSEAYATTIEIARQTGANVPDALRDSMLSPESQAKISAAASQILNLAKQKLESQGITANISVNYNMVESYTKTGKLPGYADGGIISSPTLATFAENGPEAAIPLDGSQRSVDLWQQTGDMLGVNDRFGALAGDMEGAGVGSTVNNMGTTNSPTITYSPTIQFYGSAPSQEDLSSANQQAQEDFDSLIREWFKENGRVAFGGG